MTKFGAKVLVLMIFTLGLVLPAHAWDEVGHKITAYIAWQEMTPATRDRVMPPWKPEPGYGATRRPSIRTRVAWASKPRNETEAAPVGPCAAVPLF